MGNLFSLQSILHRVSNDTPRSYTKARDAE